jgi:release factor H-coupled RctB family protein
MGNTTRRNAPAAEVRMIASPKSWIEGAAVQQLNKTAELPGMKLAVGLPDLHPGKGVPIGAAFVVEGWIYPYLVGNDVGCGIGLWRTDLLRKRVRAEDWADRLRNLDHGWSGDRRGWLAQRGIAEAGFESSLGTIGSGNHFAELQAVESMEDSAACEELGIDAESVYLCVHSGSRGLGEAILREHTDNRGAGGLKAGGEAANRYLSRHDHAVRWAAASRELIATRVAACLNSEVTAIVDVCHNSVVPCTFRDTACWLHRKGAAPSDNDSNSGLVVIPGSRGAFSYLVRPAHTSERSGWSLAHGAGRKWSRRDSRGRLADRYTARDLVRTELGSHVVCEDKDLLYEEAPQAYKNITTVIGDLQKAGLMEVIAVLQPLITYKVRR